MKDRETKTCWHDFGWCVDVCRWRLARHTVHHELKSSPAVITLTIKVLFIVS